jgi:hypothetical protein
MKKIDNSNPRNKLFLPGIILIIISAIGASIFLIYSLVQNNSIENNAYEIVDTSDLLNTEDLIENIDTIQSSSTLTQDEINGLLQMREEEKLARDVYLSLYDKWQLPIFKNIAASESTHTNSVADLLIKYQIQDPVENDARGVFTNPDFTALYNDLVDQGNISVTEALKVGATIEDLDIFDLEILLTETSNNDIMVVYSNLLKGSRNHIRSFTQNLSKYNTTYTPSYISKATYDSIISGDRETGSITN